MDTTQLLKGVLDLAVLAALRDEDGYGYDILRRLFNGGFLNTYVVPSDEGPHRKYYGLNAAGRAELQRSGKTWHGFATTMDDLLRERGVA